MAISKALQTKYPDFIKMMKQLRFDDYQIEMKLSEMEDLKEWEPITLKELQSMSQDDLSKLKSYCWHDGNPRCDCIGISHLKVTQGKYGYTVEFSDENGDPRFEVRDVNSKIDNVGDGEWNYGLYKKTN